MRVLHVRCSMFVVLFLLTMAQISVAAGPPAPITVSASGTQFGNSSFAASQTGSFTAEVDATPLASGIDGAVALSNGPQTTFTGLACIGRFNSSGFIDARNGGAYTAANSIPYLANQTYHFRFVVTLSNHTYSIFVTPPGQAEQVVGLNYAFRTEQQSVTALNNWSVFADIGSMQALNFLAASETAIANSTFTNSSFASQSGTFQAEWDAMPTASGMDGVMALSNGAQTSFTGFACLIRFFTDGTIQARNGGVYSADTTIPYSPGIMYHFRVAVNVASHTYSVFVTASGGSEQSLASNYAFRTEQAGVTALNNDGIIVDTTTGSLRFGNFALTSSSSSAYNQTVLGDHPVAFWNVNPTGSTETDLTGNGNTGTYVGGSPTTGTMPNGDQAGVFNGSTEYVTVPSNSSFSIPTTGNLTWEIWIQPTVLQFPHSDSTGSYVDVMGKCANYSPTCEWESRMYNASNSQGRCSRLSAYVFNPTAGLGSGADWQQISTCNVIQAGQWLHIVGEYTTLSQPADCPASSFPGSINIWVNGVLWNQAAHNPTGCMSQFSVTPKANNSPLNIGTMATDTWFEGAIAKVAIYNYLLTQTQINNHYQTMTGKQPTGNCNQTGGTCTF
jgi:concanavalin A-like lectin/glucanase superfamily protein